MIAREPIQRSRWRGFPVGLASACVFVIVDDLNIKPRPEGAISGK